MCSLGVTRLHILSTSSVCPFLAGHEFDEEWSWLAADEEVGQYILVHIHVCENAYLFRPVILRLFHTAIDIYIYIFFFNSLFMVS